MTVPMIKKYKRRKSEDISAAQHDGSNASAIAIEKWIVADGGDATVFLKGEFLEDPNNAYVRLERTGARNLVIPHFWVVRFEAGLFYSVSNRDFHILFSESTHEETQA